MQLILTIGKARTFDKFLPPPMLGAFDGEKVAFIPYSEVHEVFYQNDFNWNVTPSDHSTKEFKQVHGRVKDAIDSGALLFHFEKDDSELKKFIKTNFVLGKQKVTKTRIDKNNFMVIYNKWLQAVKPTIAVNWDIAKKAGIIDGDFYLADLLSSENKTIKDKLFVVLKHDHYELDREVDATGMFSHKTAQFIDKQTAHKQFWNRYERPPKEEYWDYIIGRRDLLVPQDVRERKGSFFTPQIWVELSQKYLADTLGENWQDEYTIWDCAAGTGNLLNGLTNKYNIWASTLDQQDVDVMRDRIKNGANLLESHVFQFDFLNDDFSKLPAPLREIIDDTEKRRKLVIYINPPYAEASDKKTFDGRDGKKGVEQSLTNKRYATILGQGNAEVFAQFLIRIYFELHGSILAEFSTLKIIQGEHFIDFRENFQARLEKIFVVPADTFDNVKGKFPIGFMIWRTSVKEMFSGATADVYDRNGAFLQIKQIIAYEGGKYINDWIKPKRAKLGDRSVIGKFPFKGNDFQNQSMIALVHPDMIYNKEAGQFLINSKNLAAASVYFAVRHAIDATWLNDRDQFLYPSDGWQLDTAFQNDCLAFTLFSNNIQSQYGTNHWIPFTEAEVNAREKFASNFMTQFIAGMLKSDTPVQIEAFVNETARTTPLTFSTEAQAVFDAGRALYTYYHQQPNCKVNASLYDIREHFQGRNAAGRMNSSSEDQVYSSLIKDLRDKLKVLQKAIEPKIYEYGFLK